MEAVILVGGLGTRLQSIVSDIPKPMAPVNGKPFLEFILDQLVKSDVVTKIILCTGYKGDVITEHFGSAYKNIPIVYSHETEPLGTGGAVAQAMAFVSGESFLLLNGDTYTSCSTSDLAAEHKKLGADITIATHIMTDFDRYGTVEKAGGRITKFKEKVPTKLGEINAGVYVIQRNVFAQSGLSGKFSFEKVILEAKLDTLKVYGIPYGGSFIDIGIPGDYRRASEVLK